MVEANDECAGLYGEDLEEYIRKLKEKAQAFFAQAGKEELEVYRIEQFEPVKQDAEFHGKFYQGDSYVVLKKQRANYDIHYWHGKEATAVSSELFVRLLTAMFWILHALVRLIVIISLCFLFVFHRTRWVPLLPCQCSYLRIWTWVRGITWRSRRWRRIFS